MNLLFAISLSLSILPTSAPAQSNPSASSAEIIGTWEGESKCTVPNSPCRDEHVIYEISADKNVSTDLKMEGYKIVNEARVFMGAMPCEYTAASKNLSCTFRGKNNDDWEYTLSGNILQGTLTTDAGKTLYRKISVTKKPATEVPSSKK